MRSDLGFASPLLRGSRVQWCSCASAVLSLWLGLLAGVYRAADLYSRGIVVGNCVILAQVFLIVIVVRSGGTPSMAALTQLFAVSGGLVAMLADLRRTRPLLHFFPLISNKVELRDLCRVSPSYFLITAGTRCLSTAQL